MEYEIVIGLEVHIQLKTASKLFCGCKTKFGAKPNTQVCPVCLGMPGVLPVINKKTFDYAIKAALALNCQISASGGDEFTPLEMSNITDKSNQNIVIRQSVISHNKTERSSQRDDLSLTGFTKFDRKNYYYPDLPKNYQISQYDIPFARDGHIEIKTNNNKKKIGIIRVHLEEDAGKLVHPEERRNKKQEISYSLVDLNRTGVPLLEIVSKPEINSPEEAYVYLGALKEIMQYLEISDCDMEKGSLRCDANLSVRPKGAKELGTKSEMKNLNSFKFVKNALTYEAKRQIELLQKGERIIQETRLWDETKQETQPMRSKEEAHDYRYFPEPDLVPVIIDAKWKEEIRQTIPELPEARRQRLVKQYDLSEYEADVLTQEKAVVDYAEEVYEEKVFKGVAVSNKSATSLIIGPVFQIINDQKIEFYDFAKKVPSPHLAGLANELAKKTIVSTMSRVVLEGMMTTGKTARDIIKEKGLEQVSDESTLEPIIQEVIKNNPKIVADYQGGKKTALQALIGQVMRVSKGKANPQIVKSLLQKHFS